MQKQLNVFTLEYEEHLSYQKIKLVDYHNKLKQKESGLGYPAHHGLFYFDNKISEINYITYGQKKNGAHVKTH